MKAGYSVYEGSSGGGGGGGGGGRGRGRGGRGGGGTFTRKQHKLQKNSAFFNTKIIFLLNTECIIV